MDPTDEYADSMTAIEKVRQLLCCVKCRRIPQGQIFTLGNCFHKYCGNCAPGQEKCLECNAKRKGEYAEDAFSTTLMTGLLKLKSELESPWDSSKDPSESESSRSPPPEVRINDLPGMKRGEDREKEKSSPEMTADDDDDDDFVCKAPLKKKMKKQPVSENGTAKTKAKSRTDTTGSEDTTVKETGKSKTRSAKKTDSEDITVKEKETPKPKRKTSLFESVTVRTSSRQSKSSMLKLSPDIVSRSSSSSPAITPNNVEKKNSKGETLLHVACRGGNLEKVTQLLNLGADISAVDYAGWTPLHEAINGKGTPSTKLALVKLLMKTGNCNPNIPGLCNESALHEAARADLMDIVKYLLQHGASANARNTSGKLPRDVTINEKIIKVLDDAMDKTTESNDVMSDVRIQLSKALLYFAYDVSPKVISHVEQEFHLNVSKELIDDVTHIIFDAPETEDRKVPLSSHYLQGIASGSWMLSSEWIEESVKDKKLLPLGGYEMLGCSEIDTFNNTPKLARVNKEYGNPGLFQGFCFYFYKASAHETISKKNLIKLATLSGAEVVNREPDPNKVDPLDYPTRFHLKNENNHKLILTSYIIFYDDNNKPPDSKRYDMEHMKTLKTQWLIDSLGSFELVNPQKYL